MHVLGRIEPMVVSVDCVPRAGDSRFEIKLDGYMPNGIIREGEIVRFARSIFSSGSRLGGSGDENVLARGFVERFVRKPATQRLQL
jgi:hypothetical protein